MPAVVAASQHAAFARKGSEDDVATCETLEVPQSIRARDGVDALTGRTERELFRRAAGGDQQAREQLATRYMPLARSLALRYQRSTEPFDDLLQVASLGLVKAIDGFDHRREIAFSSYAVPTILGEIKRYFRDRTWAVRVPRGLQELSLKVDRAVGRLAEDLHRQPSVGEIATAVGCDEESVLEALQAGGAYRAVSFDAPRRTDDDATTLGDSIGVTECGFDRAEERALLTTLLARVTPRERSVLRMRFEEDMTQAEIGEIIGVSQMQVSRIIRQALERLRGASAGPTPRPAAPAAPSPPQPLRM
jgi:RNA polymerase sigma-B factor